MKKEITLAAREKILKLQDFLIDNADGKNIEGTGKEILHSENFPLKHTFVDGVYVREMKMFKGTAVIGAIHKHLHMCFLLKGHLTVANKQGVDEYIAPCFIIAGPGEKRVLYSHENSVWYNTHANPSNTQDIKKLERELVAISYEEYNEYVNNKNK